jgi:integrase
MAKVNQRLWKIPGQRTKRKAWGFTAEVNGKRRKSYRAEWTRDDAQTALAKALLDVKEPVAASSGITLKDAVERYLAAKARKKSLAEMTRVLEVFKTYFGEETPLSEITASRIAEWEARRLASRSRQTGEPLAVASINRPLATLRALLRMAHEKWEVLTKAPHIKLERERGRLRWLTAEEAERLLAACRTSKNADLVDLVEFTLFTGLRQGEALELTWERVERSRGIILIEETKNDKPREVTLNGRADAVLLRRSPKDEGLVFGATSFDHFRSAWETSVRRAKLKNVRFHDLRHTFASWCVQRGATLQEVKDLLGHSSLAMTLRYAHLAPEHLRTAVSRLDDILSEVPAAVPAPVPTAVPAEITASRAQARAQEAVEEVVLLAK